MKPSLPAAVIALAMIGASGASGEDMFDGTNNLLCTMQEVYACESQSGCEAADPASVDRIRHLALDLKQRLIRLPEAAARQTSAIRGVDVVDDNLIVQGWDAGDPEVTDGAGWTMSINRSYGTMVATISGRDVAFVGLGSCIPEND